LAVPVMAIVARLSGGRLDAALMRTAFWPGVLFGASLVSSFAAFQQTSIVNATLIPSLTPVLVLLVAAPMLGERRTPKRLVWSAVAMVGVAAVVLGKQAGGRASLAGDLWAAADLVIWTVYMVVVKKVRDRGVHSSSLLAAIFLWATVVAVPWALVGSNDLDAIGGSDWFWLACMIFGPGLIGHGLMTWAQPHLDLTISSLMTLSTPPMSAGLAWLVHGESLSLLQIVGGAVVLAGLGVIALDTTPRADAVVVAAT
jgi:drug/metabolite transporter (DMT)-like permease